MTWQRHMRSKDSNNEATCNVAETKTDILTECDLKKALESNGGVKGCRVSVVEMPQRSS